MALRKIPFRPGFNKQITDTQAENVWVDGDNVRFRYGMPEKIGGWQELIDETLIGVARAQHVFADLDGRKYAAIGTNRCLYIYYDGNVYDITPIDPDRQSLESLLVQFPSDAYYCDRETALSALQNRGMFNVVDLDTGWKVDFIIRKDRSFSRVEFERRQTDELFGVRICVASPEDVILAKLEWAKMSESERQIRDAAGILRIMQHEIDADYLDSWITELGVVRQWELAKSLAGSHR